MRPDGFRPEFVDFQKGIRVGHLEPHERITQILKQTLQERYGEDFVIDRYGRGVYWQWICFVPKANRIAKPLSGSHNFSCSKLFIQVDRSEAIFKSGLHVERGVGKGVKGRPVPYQLQEDWDWHRLIAGLRSDRSRLYRDIKRLVLEDDFHIRAGTRKDYTLFSHQNFPSAAKLRRAFAEYSDQEWVVFQLYYPMAPGEIKNSTGSDLVEAILAVLLEVAPVMNHCMQVSLPER